MAVGDKSNDGGKMTRRNKPDVKLLELVKKVKQADRLEEKRDNRL